ncbi:MAG: hypothetical protein ACI89Z_001484 [Porticoccus sp.]|jgi:hypothetical protein
MNQSLTIKDLIVISRGVFVLSRMAEYSGQEQKDSR